MTAPAHGCSESFGQLIDGVWRYTQVCHCGWTCWAESGTAPSTSLLIENKRDLIAHMNSVGAVERGRR